MKTSPRWAHQAGRAVLMFHRQDEGMLIPSALVTVLFFAVVAAMMANVGQTVNAKIEAQNNADVVAQLGSTIMARGLNALTACNHLLGEAAAFICLHQAATGDPDPSDPSKALLAPLATKDQELLDGLKRAYDLAVSLRPPPAKKDGAGPNEKIYNVFNKNKWQEGDGPTPRNAKTRLRTLLAWVYESYALAYALETLSIPFMVKEGDKLELACHLLGKKIREALSPLEKRLELEWGLLEALRIEGLAVLPLRVQLQKQVVPSLAKAQTVLRLGTTKAVKTLLEQVEKANVTRAALYPVPGELQPTTPAEAGVYDLPIAAEPLQVVPIENAQLVRAAYPWLDYWRAPLLLALDRRFTLARTAIYYERDTNAALRELTQKWKAGQDPLAGGPINPPIMRDGNPANPKGTEAWAVVAGMKRADELFAVLGFARRPRQSMAIKFFPNQEDSVGAFAQAMVYNGNKQTPVLQLWQEHARWQQQLQELQQSQTQPQLKKPIPRRQVEVGWDTLNWDTQSINLLRQNQQQNENEEDNSRRVLECPTLAEEKAAQAFAAQNRQQNQQQQAEDPELQALLEPRPPKIRINWQAKLTPTTSLNRVTLPAVRRGVGQMDGEMGRILERLIPNDALLRTH